MYRDVLSYYKRSNIHFARRRHNYIYFGDCSLIGELMEVVQNGGKSQRLFKTHFFCHDKGLIVNLEDRRRLL